MRTMPAEYAGVPTGQWNSCMAASAVRIGAGITRIRRDSERRKQPSKISTSNANVPGSVGVPSRSPRGDSSIPGGNTPPVIRYEFATIGHRADTRCGRNSATYGRLSNASGRVRISARSIESLSELKKETQGEVAVNDE